MSQRRPLPDVIKNLLGARSVFMVTVLLGLCAATLVTRAAVTLNVGDILAVSTGTDSIVLTDPATGAQTVVSAGGLLSDNFPVGVAVVGNGDILATANGPSGGRIVRIDPLAETQTLVASGFTDASGITIEPNGDILITDLTLSQIIRVNAVTGVSTTVSAGGNISGPLGIAIEANGKILVTSRNNGRIVRIDPGSGAQTVVSSGGILGNPQWLAVNSIGDIFVTTPTGNAIVKIEPGLGAQSLVASGGQLFSPRGIAVDANGELVVANGNNKILRVNPVTGAVVEIAGFGIINGTSGLAIRAASASPLPEPFIFTKIGDTNTAVPGGVGNFGFLEYPSLHDQTVAFLGRGVNGKQGIYRSVGGTLSTVVDTTTVIPGTSGTFSYFSSPSVAGGNLAFYGGGSVNGTTVRGIYKNIGGVLNRVADTSTSIPGISNSRFTGFSSFPSLNTNDVAFSGSGQAMRTIRQRCGYYTFCTYYETRYFSGIYKEVGGTLSRAVDSMSLVPDVGTFSSFGNPSFKDGSTAFWGNTKTLEGNFRTGIYRHLAGNIFRVADTATLIPGIGSNFTNFGTLPSLDSGSTGFLGYGPSSAGIYEEGGALDRVADNTTAILDLRGAGFGNSSFQGGNVAFLRWVRNPDGSFTSALYTTLGGSLTKVIGQGDSFDGKTVRSIGFSREGLSGASVAFLASFTNGASGIFVASLNPDAEPSPVNALSCPALPDTDGDGTSNACDSDIDGDGISNPIDGEFVDGQFVDRGTVFSNNFTDRHLGGTTSGSIVDRSDMVIRVGDAADPNFGVRIDAAGGNLDSFATLRACTTNLPQREIALTESDSIVITCGSLETEVLAGQVEILERRANEDIITMVPTGAIALITDITDGQFTVETSAESLVPADMLLGAETLVTVSPAATATVTEIAGGQYKIESSPQSLAPVTVEIKGQVITVSPGSSGVPVNIDIKPGSSPNSINLGSNGNVPVAIFSTAAFDATTLDPLTVTLASAPVKLKGKGTPMASFEDINGDGFLDLVVHVDTSAFQIIEAEHEAILKGTTYSGTPVIGSDLVKIVP